jgi:hypothetical protein
LTQGELLEAPNIPPAPQQKSGAGTDFSLAPA